MAMSAPSASDPMIPELMTITRRVQNTPDTFTIELEPGAGGFAFLPGQFNMLYAPGCGEVPISISGDPDRPETLVHTIRAVGPTTFALSRLNDGDVVGVRGPFGTAWPDPPTHADVVFVAGGIGLAPLRPSLYRALNRGAKVYLVYGARSPTDLLYSDELPVWAQRDGVTSIVTVDRGDPGWLGNTGVVTKYLSWLGFDATNTVAMTCGPEVMMRFVARELVRTGMARSDIHVSLERNMKCGVGFCGHCQLGPHLLCKTGPVMTHEQAAPLMAIRQL